jgi:GNAT superfamily N-acetyltransferase
VPGLSDFTIRQMAEEDLPGVLELLAVALGETELLKRTEELFRWKHVVNPFGPSILMVAEADGRIVGLRAFMRWELTDPAGGVLRCVRPVDTATHPDYRRRGIFGALTETAVDEARRTGVDLIFNTPNADSGAGYRKLGWKDVGDIGVMVRPRLSPLWLRRSQRLPSLTEALAGAGAIDVGALLPARDPRGLRTPRTEKYLRWRYEQHPTARYAAVVRSGSTAVVRSNVRRGRSELLVSDVAGPEPAVVLKSSIRSARTAYVATWFSEVSPERAAARSAGFMSPRGVTALTLMARPLRPLATDATNLMHWDLALGDLELL